MVQTIYQKALPSPVKNFFLEFILGKRDNRRQLVIAVVAGFIQFIVFKYFYPYPDFISDSYSYMETNLEGLKVNLWPVGYSYFIGLIHFFTASHLVLVALQHLILELALLYFFFSIKFLFHLSGWYQHLLFIFLFFNPLFPFLSNCVLSDAVFGALTLTLFTQYLWLLFRPGISNVLIQAVVIGVAFTIRYTAIYYPAVSLVVILLSSLRMQWKFLGIVAPWLFIIPFILYTQQKTKEVTGTAEFSVFGGWQIANNALYMYEHINVDTSQLPPATRELNRWAAFYFRVVPPQQRILTDVQGTYFIKVSNAILKPYMVLHADSATFTGDFKDWGMVSPIYKAFGTHLIRKHPVAFARYYLWLNTQNYFLPYLEKFGSYNIGQHTVWNTAKTWFKLSSDDVSPVPPIDFQKYLFFLYPVFFLMLNIYFGCSLVFFLLSGLRKRTDPFLLKAIGTATAFLLLNFAFSVFATPVVLRYQIVPMIILVAFTLLLTENIKSVPEKVA